MNFKNICKILKVKKVIGSPYKKKFVFFQGRAVRHETNNLFHLGHLILLKNQKKCSKDYDIPVVYQIANQEKSTDKEEKENYIASKKIKKILKSLFNFEEVFINKEHSKELIPFTNKLIRYCNLKNCSKLFGANTSIHTVYYFFMQLAPIFYIHDKYPNRQVLTAVAEDQLPIFLLARDILKKNNLQLPIILVVEPCLDIHLKEKMSSSKSLKSVTLENLDKIKKAVSGNDKNTDFCYHVFYHLSMFISDLPKSTTFLAVERKKFCINFLKKLFKKVNFSKKSSKLFYNYKHLLMNYNLLNI